MTQDDLKLVLEALKWCHGGEPCGTAEAIAVVEKALAQEQEPVACIYKGYLYMAHEFQSGQVPVDSQPLYTTSPHRTWVGLTNKERSELVTLHHGWNEYGQAIEAKLKEKNFV